MDDLTKCLYEFMITKRLGAVWDDPEYREITRTVEVQTKRVEKNMSEEQRLELSVLLDSISAQNSIENKHRFQAALALSRELNQLVRA